jgi:hypothetical protein
MRFVWTLEVVQDGELAPPELLTRVALSQTLKCHINTIYGYEKLVREWVDDAKKYYEDEDGNELKWVELTPYLVWLILHVWRLTKRLRTRKKVFTYLFNHPEEFTEKEFENYVRQHQQTKCADAA